MNIIVIVKLLPDLVEELKVAEGGKTLDPDWIRLKINEFDDHALEQAVLLKERNGGQVIVVAIEGERADPTLHSTDDVLFTAAARGADILIKLAGVADQSFNNHTLARWLTPIIKEYEAGFILTGVQAHNDLDGSIGPSLAENLEIPYIGYVSGLTINTGTAIIRKEFAGGLVAEFEVYLPAVIGIQSSEKPPRYVAFSKIRQMMKSVAIVERQAAYLPDSRNSIIERMYEPEITERAEIIPGDAEEVADRLVEILTEIGVI